MRSIAASFSSRLEAELAAAHLAEHGVEATVRSDDAGGMLPTMQSAAGASLEVPSEDLERAKELLRSYIPPQPSRTQLSGARRIQGILVGLLFAAFVAFVVIYAALNMPSAE